MTIIDTTKDSFNYAVIFEFIQPEIMFFVQGGGK